MMQFSQFDDISSAAELSEPIPSRQRAAAAHLWPNQHVSGSLQRGSTRHRSGERLRRRVLERADYGRVAGDFKEPVRNWGFVWIGYWH